MVLAWPEHLVYRVAIAGRDDLAVGQFAVLWLGLVVVVALPGAAGTVVGGLCATRSDRSGSWPRLRRWLSPAHEDRVLRLLLGRSPDPRAWDFFFAERPRALLRLRLPDGTWLAGRFAGDSYASGFPHDPDLYPEEAWEVGGETGRLGERGSGYPLYVAAGAVERIEVLESSTAAEEA
ncbi:DUF6338 family protein [uncultured Pseudokineococcus sp.]|uniref:DUF6338 family protein n=1 Tax=uncultured Pseudokineococcus sp. TaxID=1642928 RepID=UPI00262AC9AB|nr:DUF6338 family protein [uncultured Pseudokineococcus sp.]